MIRRMWTALCAIAVLFVAACTDDEEKKPEGALPAAAELIADAAEAAEGIKSTHFVVQVDGTVKGLNVRSIEGDLTVDGESVAAKGDAVALFGESTVEARFVYIDDDLLVDLGGGQFQPMPIRIYDFSAVLDADRGLPKLVSSMRDAKTVAADDVAGTAAYKIEGTVPKDAITGIVPGADADVPATLWVSEEDRTPLQAVATFPGEGGEPATVTLTLSRINEPVTVEKPAG